jgi:hypothetical protein
LVVTITDSSTGLETATMNITITVTPDSGPVFTTDPVVYTIEENHVSVTTDSSTYGILPGNSPVVPPYSYSIGGTDVAHFVIDSVTGALSFTNGTGADFESMDTKTFYLTLTVTDSSTGYETRTVNLEVHILDNGNTVQDINPDNSGVRSLPVVENTYEVVDLNSITESYVWDPSWFDTETPNSDDLGYVPDSFTYTLEDGKASEIFEIIDGHLMFKGSTGAPVFSGFMDADITNYNSSFLDLSSYENYLTDSGTFSYFEVDITVFDGTETDTYGVRIYVQDSTFGKPELLADENLPFGNPGCSVYLAGIGSVPCLGTSDWANDMAPAAVSTTASKGSISFEITRPVGLLNHLDAMLLASHDALGLDSLEAVTGLFQSLLELSRNLMYTVEVSADNGATWQSSMHRFATTCPSNLFDQFGVIGVPTTLPTIEDLNWFANKYYGCMPETQTATIAGLTGGVSYLTRVTFGVTDINTISSNPFGFTKWVPTYGVSTTNGTSWETPTAVVDGINGSQFYSGSTAPDSGLGVNGDMYLDTVTSTLYGPKTADGWGTGVVIKGNPGNDGANGADGSRFYTGSVAPAGVVTGAIGDMYLDTVTSLLYGPKTETGTAGWGTGVSIKGNATPHAIRIQNPVCNPRSR